MEVRKQGQILRKGWQAIFVGAIIGLMALGVNSIVARASVPDINGTVHACYQTGGVSPNGQTRIIDAATQSCSADETAVNISKATPGGFVTDLVGSDFTGVSLAYRNFAGADMHNSTFGQTSLRGSDLRSADLSASAFSTTIDMTGANLAGANFTNAQWANGAQGGDFHLATLTGMQMSGTTFEAANFQGINFSDVNVYGAAFGSGSNLTGTDFTGAYALNNLLLNFDTADLTGADFSGSGHILTNARFYQAIVTGANFTDVRFEDSNLYQTDFSGAILTGATWSNTTCPDNTNSNTNGNTCIGHLVP